MYYKDSMIPITLMEFKEHFPFSSILKVMVLHIRMCLLIVMHNSGYFALPEKQLMKTSSQYPPYKFLVLKSPTK
jgi:hypothetical protein